MIFKVIEDKWQKFWEEHLELYRANNSSQKEKKYVLVEFPYPSGSGLHIGHAFSFTGGDVYARFSRMKGYEVLFPMGWDAFGLPTENYAIKTKRKPQEVTKENTDMFRSQMKRLAFSFDWSREINTTDPDYYKWTQWIFIQLYKNGLAYKKEMPINWCPSCKIGLANEEVVNGKCERCGSEVERRTISQWVVKITEYADRLIEGLKETDFIEKVKQAQINWINKSEGARVTFKIKDRKGDLEVFTTRPDTLYGATFMVMAPEHALSLELAKDNEEIKNYIKISRSKSDLERTELSKDKTGVFSGLYAINPINEKEIPIWISDFVLASYGTGAIMSVPAHDERDFAFAMKFNLPIIPVISKENHDYHKEAMTEIHSGEMINSPKWNGKKPDEAIKEAIKMIKEAGIGEGANSYHLRDWIFSRQHYWGEPIPMINCPKCGWVPVPEEQLPVKLPEVEQYEPSNDGKSPLSKIDSFVKCKCPKCNGEAERETDTMPNWAGSDWYFLRYIDPFNKKGLADFDILKKWMPVDVYIGGDEHNTLHLLYSRFIYQFLNDIGAVPKEIKEPYFKRISHGVILGPDNQRMSKSRGNIVVPETVADKYGVDVIRMYLMFIGPFDGTMSWNEKTLMGVKRFLEKAERFAAKQNEIADKKNVAINEEAEVIINKLIKGVEDDLGSFKFNTAIAKMMEGLNDLSKMKKSISRKQYGNWLKVLAPMAPYTAEELWSAYIKDGEGDEPISVHMTEWPEVDEKSLVKEKITIAIAVNGKVRFELEINSNEVNEQQKILELAKEQEKIKVWTNGKEILREIYIPGKMVNLVVK